MARQMRDTWLGSVQLWAAMAVLFVVLAGFNIAARNWLGLVSNICFLAMCTAQIALAVRRRREREHGIAD